MIIIASVMLASSLASAPPPPATVDAPVQYLCADGKLVKIAIESPIAGWISFEIPPNICAATEPKKVPERRAKPTT